MTSPATATHRADSPFGGSQKERLTIRLPYDFNERQFDELLMAAEQHRASDLRIQSGDFITAQIQGVWQTINDRPLEQNEVASIITMKYGDSGVVKLDGGTDLNFTLSAVITRDQILGFRANAVRCQVGPMKSGISIVARSIPGLPPTWEQLMVPQEITDNYFPSYGMVLTVGVTGSGKSTMQASAMLRRLDDHANPVAIGTYEAPTEFTFGDRGKGFMPMITHVQIGVGEDLTTWKQAGPNAMRRKYDVIETGEMSDVHSVRSGLEMGESGHAVYSTMHCDTPAEAVDRAISFFGETEQPATASKLRAAMRLVVAQKLVRNTQGTRSAFRSWLVFDREVKDRMGRTPYNKWQELLAEVTLERGCDFATQALPELRSGLITMKSFMAVSGLTETEAVAFAKARGFDASLLD